MADQDNRDAIQNAVAGLQSIRDMVKALATEDGDELEAAHATIQEDPLSIQVRSGWYNPYSQGADKAPAEFEILLSTGGPASRIIGTLDEYWQPDSAKIQYQDWFTPWRDLHASEFGMEPDEADRFLLEYAQQFWYGEGQ